MAACQNTPMGAAQANVAERALRPREGRRPVIAMAKMQGANMILQDIVVRNFTTDGLGARARGNPPGLHETVVVQIGPISEKLATVRWVNGDRFGLRFREPLSRADRDFLVERGNIIRPGFVSI